MEPEIYAIIGYVIGFIVGAVMMLFLLWLINQPEPLWWRRI